MPHTQDVYSPIYLIDLYLPSGMRKIATRDIIALINVVKTGGDFGGSDFNPTEGGFALLPFGEGGFGE